MKIFIDNDVILDLLLERDGFEYTSRLFEYFEKGIEKGYTSPSVLINTFYIVSRKKGKVEAWRLVKRVRQLFKLTIINKTVVDRSLNSRFTDFEDAIQYFSAIGNGCKYLVTRNLKDFVERKIEVVSPKEMLVILEGN